MEVKPLKRQARHAIHLTPEGHLKKIEIKLEGRISRTNKSHDEIIAPLSHKQSPWNSNSEYVQCGCISLILAVLVGLLIKYIAGKRRRNSLELEDGTSLCSPLYIVPNHKLKNVVHEVVEVVADESTFAIEDIYCELNQIGSIHSKHLQWRPHQRLHACSSDDSTSEESYDTGDGSGEMYSHHSSSYYEERMRSIAHELDEKSSSDYDSLRHGKYLASYSPRRPKSTRSHPGQVNIETPNDSSSQPSAINTTKRHTWIINGRTQTISGINEKNRDWVMKDGVWVRSPDRTSRTPPRPGHDDCSGPCDESDSVVSRLRWGGDDQKEIGSSSSDDYPDSDDNSASFDHASHRSYSGTRPTSLPFALERQLHNSAGKLGPTLSFFLDPRDSRLVSPAHGTGVVRPSADGSDVDIEGQCHSGVDIIPPLQPPNVAALASKTPLPTRASDGRVQTLTGLRIQAAGTPAGSQASRGLFQEVSESWRGYFN